MAKTTPADSTIFEDGAEDLTPELTNKPKNPNSKKATEVDCWSMNLDAFVLNTHIFNEKHFIAPLSRPDNSSFLPGVFSSPDAIPFVDIDGAYPWYRNSRIADITKIPKASKNYENTLRTERLGIYLHWTLPQYFRSGATTDSGDDAGKVDHTHVPDRWIVFRCITEADTSVSDPPALTAFIVESNRIRHFGGHFDPTVGEDFDVETEASPFIDHRGPVERQLDVFMGMKRKFDENWDDPDPSGRYHTPLTLLDSANPLFADFQHHNSNIFSIHDDVSWTNSKNEVVRPKTATISYAVFGYHSQHYEAKTVCHGSLYNVKWTQDTKPTNSEAIKIADRYNESQPIALGQDPLEALEAYLHSMPPDDRTKQTDWVGLIDEMKLAIARAGQGGLLNSGIPQNLRAGFKPSDGGRCWRFNNDAVGPSKEPAADGHKDNAHVPSSTEMRELLTLDQQQSYVDALERQETYLRHRLFCEWWKHRAQVSGGRWSEPKCRDESLRRLTEDLKALRDVQKLRLQNPQEEIKPIKNIMHTTARSEFFSKADPSILLGGLGNSWPAEFLTTDKWKPRELQKLPFFGEKGATLVQKWLSDITTPAGSDPLCMEHGMKLFFQNPDLVKRITDAARKEKGLMKLPQIFRDLDNLTALNFNAPGWVRITVDTLMQEWAYALGNGKQDRIDVSDKPAYNSVAETHWNDTQPCRALFVEWELEYYHLPKRFWTLERKGDGTADYVIAPGVNISSYDLMDLRKRTLTGRSLLRPNAEWVMTTLLQQLLDKVDDQSLLEKPRLKAANDPKGIKAGVLAKLQKTLKDLNLVSGSLDGMTDHLLTLHGGIHVSPYKSRYPPQANPELLAALLEKPNGQDVTPYGEDAYSIDKAERDFKPVTHGQARFTKFNIVDKFGQVISPIHNPKDSKTKPLYPCIGRSIACQPNVSEGEGFANSVELDDIHNSQYFQLGHRINQDARLNTYFAVNSADYKTYHKTTQFTHEQKDLKGHSWRPTTEYEDPVWGWLMLDFRSMGIQVYNAAGESMGQALVPDSIHGKAYWQVYYAEGDLSEVTNENSQLQQLIRRMSNTKFLVGLWSMLADACQNIYHDPMSGDPQMLNMIGRPLALVNIGMNVELATPVMETQSYQDLLKKEEITLDQYKFEVLLGDKANLHDGLIGYFPPAPVDASEKPKTRTWKNDVAEKQPDISCVYTEFGYPGRNMIDGEVQKPDAFGSPSTRKVYVSPMHVDPAKYTDAGAYQRAMHNHPSTVILGAIIDPYQPVHIATGILPSKTLKLPQWVIDQTLKKMRLLIRGGPVLMRGDLDGIDVDADTWVPPMNQTKAEASVPALSDKGEWSWLQPNVVAYAEEEDDDEYLPKFVPYNLKSCPADYPLQIGPHTVLEGFYKYGLFKMKAQDKLVPGKPTGDGR